MKCQGLVVITGGLPGDHELTFGSNGFLLVGVVFFLSSSLVGVMLFLSYIRCRSCARECIWRGQCTQKKLLVPLSPFFPLSSSLLSLSPLSSPFSFPFPSRSHSLFLSFPFPLFFFFFFLRELFLLFASEM